MAVSFDLFGTLIDVDRPDDPAVEVARELRARGVVVPDDWADAYLESHATVDPGRAYPLTDHVQAALESSGVAVEERVVSAAVRDAFDVAVTTREGAESAVGAAAERGPVGVLSNCSVPGLVERALDRSALDRTTFDAVVVSVDCGWRKPDRRAFGALADALGASVSGLVHVGDDPATDGGACEVGATPVLVSEVPLSAFPETLEGRPCL